jgi:uncharacterized protein (TIGR00369 family)
MTQQTAPGSSEERMLSTLRRINATAAFNRWAGFQVVSASAGAVELRMGWRDEVGQYGGFVHAGLIGALIDTACGFAAVTIAGSVLASHYSVNCLAPAVGRSFVARAKVVRAGKKQVFASAELFAEDATTSVPKLVATGEAILVPIQSTT